MYHYTPNEFELFKQFQLETIMKDLSPTQLYKMAVELAFCRNLRGPHVDVLRRVYNVLFIDTNSNIFRMTKEFDELIKL